MKILIETGQILLRELMPSDAAGIFELDADPEVHQFLGKRPITTLEEASAIIDFIQQQYIDYGIGRWALINKTTNEFMGWAGLKWMIGPVNNHTNYYDLGYRLIKRYWGKGYATEAAIASLNYGFKVLDQQEIYAMADSANKASQQVLEKAGLKRINKFEYEGTAHYWFAISRDEYKSRLVGTIRH